MYQAFYRKYRPKSFDDVVGQEHITETLRNQVRSGRLSHAYLFIGTRGTGKTTCAKLLARAVNCENPQDGNPCGHCRSCLGIEDGSILDVVELDAASNNGIDNVRAIRDEAIFSPASVRMRVYIVDEVHMLSTPAFNALLKILEEPPAHLMFILATTELHKIPATILSRCQRHSFRRLTADTVAERLLRVASQEGIELLPDAARLLGRLAEGSMRDGLTLLDQCASGERVDTETVLSAMGLSGNYRMRQLLDCIAAGDTDGALMLFQTLWQNGKEPASMLTELASLMRDALMLRVAPKHGQELLSGAYDEESLRTVSLEQEELLRGIDTIQRWLGRMAAARSPRMLAELCLVELCGSGVEPVEKPAFAGISSANTRPKPVRKAPEKIPAQALDAVRGESPVKVPEESVREEELPPIPDEPPWETAEPPAAVEEPIPEQPVTQATNTAPENISTKPASVPDWAGFLREAESKLSPGIYRLIADEFQTQGEFQEGELVLHISGSFAMNLLSAPDTQGKLRACASVYCGVPMELRLETAVPPKGDVDKLDGLGKFGNVTFG